MSDKQHDIKVESSEKLLDCCLYIPNTEYVVAAKALGGFFKYLDEQDVKRLIRSLNSFLDGLDVQRLNEAKALREKAQELLEQADALDVLAVKGAQAVNLRG